MMPTATGGSRGENRVNLGAIGCRVLRVEIVLNGACFGRPRAVLATSAITSLSPHTTCSYLPPYHYSHPPLPTRTSHAPITTTPNYTPPTFPLSRLPLLSSLNFFFLPLELKPHQPPPPLCDGSCRLPSADVAAQAGREYDNPLGTGKFESLMLMMTCGKGQRLGILQGAARKKRAQGKMARFEHCRFGKHVVVLVGERGREVRESG